MHNTSLPRTKIDCFTMDALEQIKAVVNNETPAFTNRGGVGKDVRELSDFALQQIKDAVGTNGGGGQGGDVVQIKKMWRASGSLDNPTFTEIQKVPSSVIFYDITVQTESGDIVYLATDDDNTPNINMTNVVLVCETYQMAVSYEKNIGRHTQSVDIVEKSVMINILGESQLPYMAIKLNYGDGK